MPKPHEQDLNDHPEQQRGWTEPVLTKYATGMANGPDKKQRQRHALNRALPDPVELAAGIRGGSRSALARGITLVESSRADHQEIAQVLLAALLPETGKAARLGLSGTPGVGKSTFIEAFGRLLTGKGLRIAVLAVDPSSVRTGGSILGDKTRMELLARDPNAFIRPSPSGGTLGGVARRTREAMLLVEAAGYDVILVETVGVGQSETSVADMVDMFLLLLAPGGGDELQGIKRGIMELADLIVVNKADGDLVPAARRAQTEYQAALHLMRPKRAGWTPHVVLASALKGEGLDAVWEAAEAHRKVLTESGDLARLRADQARAWFWTELREGLFSRLKTDPRVAALVPELERDVEEGRTTPTAAARRLLGLVLGPAEEA
ncbi:methylmalonyl Co-A mutase-associated GTPase MeaB [Parvibaculum sp.]|uniref:methylmalonyl Co-A mutase-associated GTPase MeaB n=1 Tax=Parvibaculum sp. TaxID=2024848 RepID=UPI0034A09E34